MATLSILWPWAALIGKNQLLLVRATLLESSYWRFAPEKTV